MTQHETRLYIQFKREKQRRRKIDTGQHEQSTSNSHKVVMQANKEMSLLPWGWGTEKIFQAQTLVRY
eukprot:7496540-Ditylum_brightwellii.AAC.1